MKPAAWWAIIVTGVTLGFGVSLGLSGASFTDSWGAWACLVAIVLVYFAYGRTVIDEPRGPHDVVLTVLNSGAVALGTAFHPTLAILQAVIYPMIWYTARSVKAAYLLNPIVAVAVFAGLWIFAGWADPWLALFTAAVSLAFSLAMGTWVTSMVRHGEERSRLLDELQSVQDELAARNHEAGVTSERERIARELHDTIAQNLTAIVMLTQRAGKRLGRSDEPSSQDLELVESLAQEALTETRALVAAMSPVDIETGLADALSRLAIRFERETGVAVRIDADVSLAREQEVVLLRCVQEALANVRKHAKASRVEVTVQAIEGEIVLAVQDDGIGIANEAGDGFGLAGMRTRLALVGGTLELSSEGRGTMLRASLPEVP